MNRKNPLSIDKSIFAMKLMKNVLKISFYTFMTALSITNIPFEHTVFAKDKATKSSSLSPKTFIAEAISRSGPAVVTIETQRKIYSRSSRGGPSGLLLDPYFDKFFNLPNGTMPRSRIENGQGSGVIFSKKGHILTNAHVVDQIDRLTVGLSNGRRYEARVIGVDSLTDLAVITLKGPGPWPSATLGDSDQISVGDWAIAVGNPFGLENTVTLGIISNLNRNVSQLGISDKRISLIQTDAAINPGNSGGPLLNANGEVIGINTLVRSGPGAGLGFAIPINKAKEIAGQLIRNGKATHPMIGVSLSNMPLVDENGKDSALNGALVRYLIPNGPADKSGLKINDIIIEVQGKKIKNSSDVVRLISENGVNKILKFKILRDKKYIYLSIKPIDINQLGMK